jgi:hypothetical protein
LGWAGRALRAGALRLFGVTWFFFFLQQQKAAPTAPRIAIKVLGHRIGASDKTTET